MDPLERIEYGVTHQDNPNEIPQDVLVRYRSVFGKGFGIDVLADLLWRLRFLEPIDGSPQSVARQNLAVNLLANIGALKPDASGRLELKDVRKIVGAMLPLITEETDKRDG